MPSGADKSKGQPLQSKDGLKQIVDLLKFTLALATGSLVFSVGLLTENINLTCYAKHFLFFSWLALAISATAGVFAYMRIPMLIAKKDYNMRDKFMEIPGKIHHIAFVIGLLSLGIALAIALFGK